jgi:hypothetical protein
VPKQINTPTPGRTLVRRFGLKGRFQPILDEVIVPVTSVDQDVERRPAIAGNLAAAAAGENSSFQLLNPNDSGIIVRVEQIWVHSNALQNLRLSLNPVWTLGTKTKKAALWRERSLPGVPVAEFYHGQSTFLNQDLGFISMSTIPPTLLTNLGIVLPSGASVMMQNDTVNATFFTTILWTEEYTNPTDAP